MGEAEVDMNLLRKFTENNHVSQFFWASLSVKRVSLSKAAIILFCALIKSVTILTVEFAS